jgi:hypothetical protein
LNSAAPETQVKALKKWEIDGWLAIVQQAEERLKKG